MEIGKGPEEVIWRCALCNYEGPAKEWAVEFPSAEEILEDALSTSIDHCPRCRGEQYAQYVRKAP